MNDSQLQTTNAGDGSTGKTPGGESAGKHAGASELEIAGKRCLITAFCIEILCILLAFSILILSDLFHPADWSWPNRNLFLSLCLTEFLVMLFLVPSAFVLAVLGIFLGKRKIIGLVLVLLDLFAACCGCLPMVFFD